ncbi:TetR/AcrR family transcriptional regulator [Pseudoduganella sp. SL102]|uniref:TetR/AcrR family transcriptional regulator n=1 Tax=Pseudoduganella sp. SL102 TaxID=2995154 RepID=UPI00248C18C2|nr:TetR/AcrR family transcriptional regulator [Pseudoduganella sp. SL102]WBS00678.1 TetR/AcrR family transcriptional regulator [Pseudoduganella sp. SL102]
MAPKRVEMMAETRAKLINAARAAFASKGFAESSMDDLTAQAGLTRGALYHHFGDKKGLLEAVIAQVDGEMTARLAAIMDAAPTTWDAFVDESIAYIEMATEPEIQRIMLLDGPAVLGDPSQWPGQNSCIRSTQRSLELLMEEGVIREVDAPATSRLINGALLSAALWIAHAEDPESTSRMAVDSFVVLVSGLLKTPR